MRAKAQNGCRRVFNHRSIQQQAVPIASRSGQRKKESLRMGTRRSDSGEVRSKSQNRATRIHHHGLNGSPTFDMSLLARPPKSGYESWLVSFCCSECRICGLHRGKRANGSSGPNPLKPRKGGAVHMSSRCSFGRSPPQCARQGCLPAQPQARNDASHKLR